MPAPLVSLQWKQRLLSHQITSHLNTHIVRISQINLIRILLPGVPPGCNQLHCIWIKLTSCCHSKVSLDCCTLWSSPVSKRSPSLHAVMCFQNMSDLNSAEIAGSPPVQREAAARGYLYVDCRSLEETSNQNLGIVFSSSPLLLGRPFVWRTGLHDVWQWHVFEKKKQLWPWITELMRAPQGENPRTGVKDSLWRMCFSLHFILIKHC